MTYSGILTNAKQQVESAILAGSQDPQLIRLLRLLDEVLGVGVDNASLITILNQFKTEAASAIGSGNNLSRLIELLADINQLVSSTVNGRMIAFTATANSITGVTGETLITSLLIPAGTLTDNMRVLFQASVDATNNADNKTIRLRVGPVGTELSAASFGAGGIATSQVSAEMFRPAYTTDGTLRAYASLSPAISGATLTSSALNYAVDNYMYITGVPVNAANTITCRAASIIIWRQ